MVAGLARAGLREAIIERVGREGTQETQGTQGTERDGVVVSARVGGKREMGGRDGGLVEP